jgi:TPP-dependent pyruvate/acetoin dehydrogenase alpha subunit
MKLEKGEALRLYRQLVLIRQAEERIRREYPLDEMKTPVHLSIGEEAIPVGVWSCLPRGAKAFGTYRSHALYLAVTEDTDGLFAELYGKRTGPGKGKAGSMHLAAADRGLVATSAVVGTTIPLAVGAAFAQAFRQRAEPVVSFFGDGAVEEGVFWESLNFACLRRLNLLFVCEDNGLAIHTPVRDRHGFRSIPEAVQGFDCHVKSADGSRLVDVIDATRAVLQLMREDPKPAFLHFTYFRFLEHVGIREDFDAGYRRRPTPEEAERLDPVRDFEQLLHRHGCRPEELTAIRREVDAHIARSVAAAQQAPFAPPSELQADVFA